MKEENNPGMTLAEELMEFQNAGMMQDLNNGEDNDDEGLAFDD